MECKVKVNAGSSAPAASHASCHLSHFSIHAAAVTSILSQREPYDPTYLRKAVDNYHWFFSVSLIRC